MSGSESSQLAYMFFRPLWPFHDASVMHFSRGRRFPGPGTGSDGKRHRFSMRRNMHRPVAFSGDARGQRLKPRRLTVDEAVRQARLASRRRSQGQSYWHRLEESNVAVTRGAYSTFGLVPVDTTGLSPAEVTDELVGLAQSVRVHHV